MNAWTIFSSCHKACMCDHMHKMFLQHTLGWLLGHEQMLQHSKVCNICLDFLLANICLS